MPNSEDSSNKLSCNNVCPCTLRISFRVEGVPPKKTKSMWSDVGQSTSLINLRNQALAAKKNFGVKDCFTSSIKLELETYARKSDLDSMGDLDNLLGGVCDGLGAMPTNPTLVPSEWFSTKMSEVPPTIPILYNDDKIITSIKGTKIEIFGDPYYIIKIYEL